VQDPVSVATTSSPLSTESANGAGDGAGAARRRTLAQGRAWSHANCARARRDRGVSGDSARDSRTTQNLALLAVSSVLLIAFWHAHLAADQTLARSPHWAGAICAFLSTAIPQNSGQRNIAVLNYPQDVHYARYGECADGAAGRQHLGGVDRHPFQSNHTGRPRPRVGAAAAAPVGVAPPWRICVVVVPPSNPNTQAMDFTPRPLRSGGLSVAAARGRHRDHASLDPPRGRRVQSGREPCRGDEGL
jgi:hypothetical protein